MHSQWYGKNTRMAPLPSAVKLSTSTERTICDSGGVNDNFESTSPCEELGVQYHVAVANPLVHQAPASNLSQEREQTGHRSVNYFPRAVPERLHLLSPPALAFIHLDGV